jgi:uncharacterized RDD family membrane protein YckC
VNDDPEHRPFNTALLQPAAAAAALPPTTPPPPPEAASRGSRLGAKVLDWITALLPLVLAGGVAIALVPAFLLTHRAEAWTALRDSALLGILALAMMLGYVALAVWNAVWLHRYGQTIGKRLLGIRIVRGDGSRASLGRIFALRYLPMALLGGLTGHPGGLVKLVDVLCIFRDDRRCLHDLIADTRVVRADDPDHPPFFGAAR